MGRNWNGYEFREARYPVDGDGDIPPVSLPESAEHVTLDREEGYVIVRYLLPEEV